MHDTTTPSTRRDFIQAAGAAAGILALGATSASADEAAAPPINALMPTPEQMQAFLKLEHDGPIVMVNLLKFKADGGQAEYAKYAAGVAPILEKLGAKVLFSGEARLCLIGNADWDAVALVEYPNKLALVRMSQSPEYQAIHKHREAGLEGQVNYAVVPMALPTE